MLFSGTTVNDSETIGRTNGVNHRQSISIAERFVHLCLLYVDYRVLMYVLGVQIARRVVLKSKCSHTQT